MNHELSNRVVGSVCLKGNRAFPWAPLSSAGFFVWSTSHCQLRRFRSCSSHAVFFEYLSVSVSRPPAPSSRPSISDNHVSCSRRRTCKDLSRHVSIMGLSSPMPFGYEESIMTALDRYRLNCERNCLNFEIFCLKYEKYCHNCEKDYNCEVFQKQQQQRPSACPITQTSLSFC